MEKGKKLIAGILSSILVLVSLPILSGCQAEEPSFLLGTVELDNPIVQATISIYDTKGKMLYEETEETSNTGVFVLEITKPLPDSFRIEATGGRDAANDEPFNGIITAEIRDYYEQNYTSLHLGPVSTLVTSYMEKHSEIPYEDAQIKVLEFLDLDPNINIMHDMLSIKGSIYPAIFEAEAIKAGGFNKFINILIEHIDTEGGRYHDIVSAPFGVGPVTLGVGGTVAKTLLLGLLEGIAQKGGSEAAGWMINKIRGGDTSDSTVKALADISSKLDNISTQIQELDRALARGIEDLKNQAEYLNYETAARGLEAPISVIETALGNLRNIASLDSTEEDFEKSLNYYIDEINAKDIETALQQIHNVLVDRQGVRGITRVWGEMALGFAEGWSWKNDKYPNLESQFEYYASLQLAGLTVLIDKYHSENNTATVTKINVEKAISDYKNHIQAQGDLFLTSVESQLAWHTQCYHSDKPHLYQKEWSYHWNFRSKAAVIDKAIESATLKKADTILGEYLGLQNSITIRIFNTGKKHLSGNLNHYYMGLSLASGGKDGPRVTEPTIPQIITTQYPSQGDSSCEQGGKGYTAQFARYRFDNLEPGVYYISDNNRGWRSITKGVDDETVLMINTKLLSLPFNVTEEYPFHNQLIVAWLSEKFYKWWD